MVRIDILSKLNVGEFHRIFEVRIVSSCMVRGGIASAPIELARLGLERLRYRYSLVRDRVMACSMADVDAATVEQG